MLKALANLFKKSEDTRGTVTAAQAMAYVEACSDKWSTYKATDATKHDDGELIVWNVTASYTPDEGDSALIDFHVWEVNAGDYGYNRRPKTPHIYGEW